MLCLAIAKLRTGKSGAMEQYKCLDIIQVSILLQGVVVYPEYHA